VNELLNENMMTATSHCTGTM